MEQGSVGSGRTKASPSSTTTSSAPLSDLFVNIVTTIVCLTNRYLYTNPIHCNQCTSVYRSEEQNCVRTLSMGWHRESKRKLLGKYLILVQLAHQTNVKNNSGNATKTYWINGSGIGKASSSIQQVSKTTCTAMYAGASFFIYS